MSEENKDNYRKQRNICFQSLRKIKRLLCQPECLSNEVIANQKVTFIEGDKITKNDKQTAEVLKILIFRNLTLTIQFVKKSLI